MKKLLRVSVVVVLALAVAVAFLTVTVTSAAIAGGKICPSVGWNNGIPRCSFAMSPARNLQELAYAPPPPAVIDVGWNK